MPNTATLLERPTQEPSKLTPAQAALLESDPLLTAVGLGRELWADEHADEYVARLRKDW